MMEYVDVPLKVKRWIEEEEWSTAAAKGKGLFAVLAKADVEKGEKVVATATSLREKKPETEEEEREWREGDVDRVVIFAPGAIYENAPLWVAEGSDCEGKFSSSLFLLLFFIFFPPFFLTGLRKYHHADNCHRNPLRHDKVHCQTNRRRRRGLPR